MKGKRNFESMYHTKMNVLPWELWYLFVATGSLSGRYRPQLEKLSISTMTFGIYQVLS